MQCENQGTTARLDLKNTNFAKSTTAADSDQFRVLGASEQPKDPRLIAFEKICFHTKMMDQSKVDSQSAP